MMYLPGRVLRWTCPPLASFPALVLPSIAITPLPVTLSTMPQWGRPGSGPWPAGSSRAAGNCRTGATTICGRHAAAGHALHDAAMGRLLFLPGEVVDHHVSRLEAPRHPAPGPLGRVHPDKLEKHLNQAAHEEDS